MAGLGMINSNKMNLAARRKGAFLSKEASSIKINDDQKYQFPQTSEKEKRDVRKKIQEEMKWERRMYWTIGLVTLIIMITILF